MVTGFFRPQRAHFFSFLQKESEYRDFTTHSNVFSTSSLLLFTLVQVTYPVIVLNIHELSQNPAASGVPCQRLFGPTTSSHKIFGW
jgi:hypothetical protein